MKKKILIFSQLFFIGPAMCSQNIDIIKENNTIMQNDMMEQTNNQINLIGSKMINIGINEEHRKLIAQKLNNLLADEYVLYTKTYKFHWNVKGKNFAPLHKLFEGQYEQLADFVDGVAERCLKLGFNATGTLSEFSKHTKITESPGQYPTDMQMIQELLNDHELIIRELRPFIDETAKLGDQGTSNFLTDLAEKHEKIAWMLRAHLE